MANEANNPKFNFLKPTDPFHAYYLHRVREAIQGPSSTATTSTSTSTTTTATSTLTVGATPSSTPGQQSGGEEKETTEKERRQRERSKQLLSTFQELLAPKEKPPDFEFIADPPTISALDMFPTLFLFLLSSFFS